MEHQKNSNAESRPDVSVRKLKPMTIGAGNLFVYDTNWSPEM
jgi:hypothetical protein